MVAVIGRVPVRPPERLPESLFIPSHPMSPRQLSDGEPHDMRSVAAVERGKLVEEPFRLIVDANIDATTLPRPPLS